MSHMAILFVVECAQQTRTYILLYDGILYNSRYPVCKALHTDKFNPVCCCTHDLPACLAFVCPHKNINIIVRSTRLLPLFTQRQMTSHGVEFQVPCEQRLLLALASLTSTAVVPI